MKNPLPSIIDLELKGHKNFTMMVLVLLLLWVLPSKAALSSTPMPPPTSCGIPVSVTLSNFTVDGVDLNFVPSDTTVNLSFDYEIQSLDSAQGSPSLILSGNTGDSESVFTITGLNPGTYYTVYVRAICESDIASEWTTAPLNFHTLFVLSCGDTWYDAGGSGGDYVNGASEIYNVCPDNAGEVVSVVFTSFDVEDNWDALYIHDGPDDSFSTLFGTDYILSSGFPAGGLTGNSLPNNGLPIYSNHSSGCLTFEFMSDTAVSTTGWSAEVGCGNAPVCGAMYNEVVTSVTGNSASISAQASNYGEIQSVHWEVQPYGSPQGTPGGIVGVSDSILLLLEGLSGSTIYTAYFQVECTSGDLSFWTSGIDFTTAPDCETAIELIPGLENSNSFIGPGAWNLGPDGTGAGPFNTPGAEVIYKLTVPAYGVYTFSGFGGNGWVDYFIKPVISGCNDQNWTFMNEIFASDSFTAWLDAGEYYILLDAESGDDITNSTFVLYSPFLPTDWTGVACNNPLVITCGQSLITLSIDHIINTNSLGMGELFDCQLTHNAGSFWFEYTSAINETITLGTLSAMTNFSSRVSVFSGECGNLTCMTTSDGSAQGEFSAFVTFEAQAGQTYYFAVGGSAADNEDRHFQLGIESTCGCTDALACNYDPQASVDNGSCLYGSDCEACTNPFADNYSPYATTDDGSCTYTAKYMVYNDSNANGVLDNGEVGLPNMAISIQPLNVTIFTNALGEAQIELIPNEIYLFAHLLINSAYANTSSLYASVYFPMDYDLKYFGVVLEEDFGNNLNVIKNVDGTFHCNNGYYAGTSVYNFSSFPVHGQFTMTCDPLFTPENFWPAVAPDSVAPGFASWEIQPFGTGGFEPRFYIEGPGSEYMGQQFSFNYQLIIYDVSDNEIYNQEWTQTKDVLCAFDPNDIAVTPVGYAAPHFVSKGEELTYKIRFQNTGNYLAEDITVVDLLDPTVFDLSTFTPIISSDNMFTCLHDDGIVDFVFNDINLPDSTSDEPGSHGWLIYKVSLLEDIDANAVANNFADIYFEQNPPITTNTVFNTVFDCESFTGIVGESDFCDGEIVSFSAEQMYVDTFEWTVDSVVVSNAPVFEISDLEIGEYAITLNVSNPICEMTQTTAIALHPLPAIDAGEDTAICAGESFILQATSEDDVTWSTGQTNGEAYYPAASEVLHANATNIFGCVSSDELNLTVHPLPTIAAGEDEIVCEGSSIMLQATSNGSITWTGGWANGEAYYPTASELLQANATNIFGCTSSDDLNIILAALPGNVLSENGATLTAPAGTSWQWYYNNELMAGATTQSIVVTQSGNYNVVTTNENDCTSTSESVFVTIGIAEGDSNELRIYPNPIQETAFVQLPSGIYQIRLFDSMGKLAMDMGSQQNSFAIERSGLASGKYQLELSNSTGNTYVTLIFE